MAYLNFQEAQVTGSFVGAIFAFMLYALTFRRLHGVSKVSAQLMSLGFFITSVQFTLQRLFCFHAVDPALGFSVNLSFFMLATYLLFTAQLYLLRQGRLRLREWCVVPLAWSVCVCLMFSLRYYYKEVAPDTVAGHPVLMWANYFTATVYIAEVVYLYFLLRSTYRKVKCNVEEFFDRPTDEMIGWVSVSMHLLGFLSVCIPVCLFFRTQFLILFLYFIVLAMSYLAVTFTFFSVSRDAAIAGQAEALAGMDSAMEAAPSVDEQVLAQIAGKLDTWLEAEGFLRHNLSITEVAETTGLGVEEIRRWLTATEKGMFSQWLSHLRTDHAKQLLLDQPNWSFDAIADACGFTNRQSFARAFKKETGCSPSDWINQQKG